MRYCQVCHRCFGDGAEYCLFDQTPTFLVNQLPVVIDGKYRLEQLIAHGGMGSVYRAIHQQLERPVAIKILRAEFLADRVIAERFNREARAAAKLKHPNIVAIYDFGFLPNGGAYLVMELIEGRSLREELRTYAIRQGQFGQASYDLTGYGQVGRMMRPERAAAIMSQVCAGIEAAHRHGIIHRDLKPDNVMIETTADAAERVLVLDFGIAKLKDRDQGVRGITDENTIIGTPNYISPEQCTGQAVDARSDIYSLGVILYEMLTGRTPFASQNTSAVLLRHLQEPPAPPSRFRAGLGRELESVVLRALAKNPSHRFPSASQFAEHLAAAVKSSQRYIEEAEEEFDETVETLPRRPMIVADEITGVQPRPLFNASLFDSPILAETAEVRPPTLLIERQPRTRFNAAVVIAILALLSFFSYLWLNEWRAEADESSGQPPGFNDALETSAESSDRTEGSKIAQPANSVGAKQQEPAESGGVKTMPVSYSRNDAKPDPLNTSSSESVLREVKSLYSEWANTATRGDWGKHQNFYADRVDYFRDGKLTREAVGSRKRRILGGFDSYSLKFTQSPQIRLRQNNGAQEADVIFDRQWTLKRKRKRIEGKAQGLITLRREARGWRIISEKQIKK
ncbi:MAG: serine/threonine-protein kinase [Blastocatellales bacterium]